MHIIVISLIPRRAEVKLLEYRVPHWKSRSLYIQIIHTAIKILLHVGYMAINLPYLDILIFWVTLWI